MLTFINIFKWFSFLFLLVQVKYDFVWFDTVMENKRNRGCARHQQNLWGRAEIRLSPQNEMYRLHCNVSLYLQIREFISLPPLPW